MKKALYIILLALISINVKGYSFKVTISDLPRALAIFKMHYGHKQLPIDTLVSNEKGEIELNFGKDAKPGLYRVAFSSKYYIDFIFNNEDIEISTLKAHWNDSLKIIKSKETQAYHLTKKSKRTFNWKMKQLSNMLDTTSKTNPYYQIVKNEHYKLQKEQVTILSNLKKNFSDLLITKMAQVDQSPMVGVLGSSSERKDYEKKNFFNIVSFTDTTLLYTNTYSNKVYEYLRLYYNSKLTQVEQQQEYINAVDNLMPLAYAGNTKVFEQVVDFLIDHFSRLRFDDVLNHILETYVDEHSCENYEVKSSYEDRINKFLKIKVGDKAPNFNVLDVNDKSVSLESSKAQYTLLVFWASWCPHCTDELPKIQKIYNGIDRSKLEVIAFSLDKDKEKWKAFVKNGNYDWISCSDQSSWKSEVVSKYNVYGTPTIFIIDQNQNIISKPSNIGYLKSDLKKYIQ